jgi:hypothetical protein
MRQKMWVTRRPVLCAAVAVAAILAATANRSGATSTRIVCGGDRWSVGTLQDRPLLLPARRTTVRYLVNRLALPDLPAARRVLEHRVFTVIAAVTRVRAEDDGDLQLVLRSGGEQMIAAAPDATCTTRAAPRYRGAMALARELVRVCDRARVTGVAFFDSKRGQTGGAANGIELHPVLGFHCLARY